MSDVVGLTPRPAWWTSDHWATPPSLIRKLELEFGAFDLDPACHHETAKAPKFYTPADDGLSQPWFGRVFLNPPYSNVTPWLEKAIAETTARRASLVIALLPVCTDTDWFHDFVLDRAEIRFIKRRVRFYGWGATMVTAPKFPSMFAIYRAALAAKEQKL